MEEGEPHLKLSVRSKSNMSDEESGRRLSVPLQGFGELNVKYMLLLLLC